MLMLLKRSNYSNYLLLLNEQPPIKHVQFWPTISNIKKKEEKKTSNDMEI